MDRTAAIAHIQDSAKTIALAMMKIHPALSKLGDAETQGDCIKALHEMTVQLEIVKKKLIKLQKNDDSSLL
jgi:hypothetical protein